MDSYPHSSLLPKCIFCGARFSLFNGFAGEPPRDSPEEMAVRLRCDKAPSGRHQGLFLSTPNIPS